MTGVLMRAGACCRRSAASSRSRTSSSRCCRCRRSAEALHHYETPLIGVAVAHRRSPASAAACVLLRRRRRARPSALQAALRRRCTGCSSGKYYVDELYEARARPAAALDLGARVPARSATALLIDGTLQRPGRAARSARPGGSARVQTGNLHLYAFLRAGRHRRRARCGAGAMADAVLLNLVLCLPVLGMRAAASRCPTGTTTRVRALHARRDGRCSSCSRAWLYAALRRRASPGLQFETRLPWIADWGVLLPDRPGRLQRAAGAAHRLPRAAGGRRRVHARSRRT
ncbi:MAG: hypothetical protein MZV64_44635 [Ignavibacteriales bacterium]|nr:hypothetical protein [Ignavibacteriales bacterium]